MRRILLVASAETKATLFYRPHLIQFGRVLAANAALRARVVLKGQAQAEAATEARAATECEAEISQRRPHHISWARLLRRLLDIDHVPLPDLRRRQAQHHRRHPGAGGDRKGLNAPGSADPRTAAVRAASGGFVD